MIRYIDSIEQYSSISLPDGSSVKRFQRIDFEIESFAKGTFGGVHRVESIDDRVPEIKLVLKLVPVEEDNLIGVQSLKTIGLLHDKVRKHEAKTRRPFFQEHPELIGIPLAAFVGKETVAEKRFNCFLMLDLTALGYRDLAESHNVIKVADEAGILDRMYLSYQFFRAIDWMHRNDFNHADLSLSALFLQDDQLRLVLIDYDGGYHFKHQQSPLSLGKLGYWGSHLFNQLRTVVSGKQELSILDRLQDEYFTAAAAFFELLFEAPPYFFLEPGEDVRKKYLEQYKWPEMDFSQSYANKSSKSLHENLLRNIQVLEANGAKELIDGFRTVFGKGYFDGKYRLTTARWKRLVKKILTDNSYDPLVQSFLLNKTEVRRADEEVVLTWKISRADQIRINGKHVNFAKGTQEFKPGGEANYTLDVANDFGSFSLDVAVVANKVDPVIKEFSASATVRDSLAPIRLTWDTEHTDHIYLNGKQLDNQGTYSVEPKQETTYSLVAVGHFGQRVEKTLTISVVAPVIIRFDYEVNLEHGIKNVDLRFDVTDCESLSISPRIGVVDPTGNLVSILIDERTEFTLTAKGLFQDTVEQVTAIPFPIPSVLQLSPPHPTIEIHTQLNPEVLQPNLQLLAPELKLPLLETLGTMIDIDPLILDEAIRVPDFTSLQLKPKEEAVRTLSFAEAMSSFKSVYQKHLEKND
jgi:hypothetical protein